MTLKPAFPQHFYVMVSISIPYFIKSKGDLCGEMLNVYFEQKLIILSVSPVLLKVIKFCPLCNLKQVQQLNKIFRIFFLL